MCIPAPVAAALAVVQGIGEYKAASAATKAHNQQAEANNINAATARDLQIRQLGQETEIELRNLEQEKLDAKLEMLRTTDKALVAGAEAGVSGNSLNTVTNEFMRRGLNANTASSTDQANVAASEVVRSQGIQSQALSRLMQKKAKPSALMAAVKTGISAGVAFNAFAAPAATAGSTAATGVAQAPVDLSSVARIG